MESYIDIKKYLLNNLHFLKEYKIKNDYKLIKKYYNSINHYLDKNLHKNMKGGEIGNLQEANQKVETLQKVFSLHEDLEKEIPNLKEKVKNLANQTGILIEKLNNIDVGNLNISKINKDDFIKTMISLEDTDLTSLSNINTTEFKESINYYKINPDYKEFKNSNYIDSIIDNFKQKIDSPPIVNNNVEKQRILNELSEFNKKIKEMKNNLIQEIKQIKNRIDNYKNMIKYDFNSEFEKKNIIFINKKDMIDGKTKTTRNKFLQIQAIGGKLKVMNMVAGFINRNTKIGGKTENTSQNPKEKDNSINDSKNPQIELVETKKAAESLNKVIETHRYFVNKINEINKYETGHTNYLLTISSNKFFQGERYEYRYIEKNDLNLYSSIIDDILKINYNKKDKNEIDSDIPDFIFSRDLVTLKKLRAFLSAVNLKIKTEQVIDVENCNDDSETRHRLILLNNYVSILDDFKAKKLNKITMYARINDIKSLISPENENFMKKKLFMSDIEKSIYIKKFKNEEYETDAKKLIINQNACSEFKSTNEDKNLFENGVRFTEVFDSMQYQLNETLANHMGLNALLTMKKKDQDKNGIIIVTYGYSGTGKTYTLFGDGKSKSGILQSTLNTIKNLKKVYFRLYELYGHGLSYPHYWEQGVTGISHKIFKYKLSSIFPDLKIDDVEIIECEKNKSDPKIIDNKILDFVNDYNKDKLTYKIVEGNNVEKVFKSFPKFMDVVENFRENKCKSLNDKITQCNIDNEIHEFKANIEKHEERRIRDTNNNIVSSRSILVYDFIISYMEDKVEKTAPFIIIDLPGREEIIQTYINPYFELSDNKLKSGDIIAELYLKGKEKISTTDFKNKMLELKFLFTSMAINPIAISLFDPENIIKFFNNTFDINDKKKIFEEHIETKYELIIDKEQINKDKDGRDIKEKEKHHNQDKDKLIIKSIEGVNYIVGIKDGGKERGFKFLEEIINYKAYGLKYFCEIDEKYNVKVKNNSPSLFSYEKESDMQKYGLLCIHLINRILVLNHFDMLNKIYDYLAEKYLNRYLRKSVENIKETDAEIYLKKLEETNFKREFIFRKKEHEKSINKDNQEINKKILKDVIEYNYYLTPLEGIYINENISGIVKYLSTNDKLIVTKGLSLEQIKEKIKNISKESEQKIRNEKFTEFLVSINISEQQHNILTNDFVIISKSNSNIKEEKYGELSKKILALQKEIELNKIEENLENMKQDKNLDFLTQQKIVRMWLVAGKDNDDKSKQKIMEFYKLEKDDEFRPSLLETSKDNDGLFNFDYNDMKEQYSKMVNVYKSDKIFEFKKTLIEDILKPYLNDISDFKVIYLFGNYDKDDTTKLKCQPQIKLLKNTLNFIDNIVESKLVEDENDTSIKYEQEDFYQNIDIENL